MNVRKNGYLHLCAWFSFISVALLIGCGDGDEPGSLDYTGKVNNVELHPRTKIVPFDGSAVVSAIGERGIEIKGVNLGNVEPGDYLIVIAPIEDQARTAIGHTGGFVTLKKGWHLVPRIQLPERYKTPGNANYSHFVIHFGLAGERLIETGPLAVEGSKSFASNSFYTKRFIGSVGRAFSKIGRSVASVGKSAAKGVTSVAKTAESNVASVATSAAKGAAQAATSAATDVATVATKAETAVTSAGRAIANDVTSGVSEAASAVASAASSLGPIEQVVSTIETVGVHFSEIVKGMALEVEQIATDPKAAFEELKEFAEFILTGDASFSVSEDGTYNFNFQNLQVSKSNESGQGTVSASLNGQFSVKYDESASLNFSDYKPSSIGYTSNISGSANLTLSQVEGNGTFPIRTIRKEPIVLDAGIPVILVPEIAITGVVDVTGTGSVTAGVSTTSTASSTATFSGVSGNANMTFDGTFAPSTVTGTNSIALRVKPELKLYDVAGPFVDIAVLDTTFTASSNSSTATVSLSTDATLGADLTGLGFSGFTPSAPLFSKTWKTFDVDL